MPLENVPRDHVVHIIGHYVKDQALANVLIEEAHIDLPAVVTKLAKFEPGLAARLEHTWAHRSTTSIHMWNIKTIKEGGQTGLRTRVGQALAPHLNNKPVANGQVVIVPPPTTAADDDRVSSVVMRPDDLIARVRLSYERDVPVDTTAGTETVITYQEVVIIVNATTGLAEGYTGHNNGVRALRALLRLLYPAIVPKNDKDDKWRTQWMNVVKFTEQNVRAFTTHHDYEFNGVQGADPGKYFGTVALLAKTAKGKKIAFDPNNPRVKAQESQENEMRRYDCIRTMPVDGYKEPVTLRFMLDSHPHITFVGKTSRPAMVGIVSSFEEYVRSGML